MNGYQTVDYLEEDDSIEKTGIIGLQIHCGAACFSTRWIGNFEVENNPIPESFYRYLRNHLPGPSSHKIYFDHGTISLDEKYFPLQKEVDLIMEMNGFIDSNWKSMVFEGDAHDKIAWGKRLHIPVTFLLGRYNKMM